MDWPPRHSACHRNTLAAVRRACSPHHEYSHRLLWRLRAQDMRLRLKYAGADDAAITVYDTADDLAAAVQKAGKPVVLLPNYTSMLTVRDKLSALAGGGRFWE